MLYVLGYTHPLAPKNTTKQKIEKGERRRKKGERMMREGSHFMTGWPSTIGFAEFTPQRPPLFQYQVAPKKAYTTQVRGNCSSDSNQQHALPFSPSLSHCETIE